MSWPGRANGDPLALAAGQGGRTVRCTARQADGIEQVAGAIASLAEWQTGERQRKFYVLERRERPEQAVVLEDESDRRAPVGGERIAGENAEIDAANLDCPVLDPLEVRRSTTTMWSCPLDVPVIATKSAGAMSSTTPSSTVMVPSSVSYVCRSSRAETPTAPATLWSGGIGPTYPSNARRDPRA